jgi:hypothetical protein
MVHGQSNDEQEGANGRILGTNGCQESCNQKEEAKKIGFMPGGSLNPER